jgi:hypothetical protein
MVKEHNHWIWCVWSTHSFSYQRHPRTAGSQAHWALACQWEGVGGDWQLEPKLTKMITSGGQSVRKGVVEAGRAAGTLVYRGWLGKAARQRPEEM